MRYWLCLVVVAGCTYEEKQYSPPFGCLGDEPGAAAANVVVQGSVVNPTDRKPIANTSVSLLDRNLNTIDGPLTTDATDSGCSPSAIASASPTRPTAQPEHQTDTSVGLGRSTKPSGVNGPSVPSSHWTVGVVGSGVAPASVHADAPTAIPADSTTTDVATANFLMIMSLLPPHLWRRLERTDQRCTPVPVRGPSPTSRST